MQKGSKVHGLECRSYPHHPPLGSSSVVTIEVSMIVTTVVMDKNHVGVYLPH